MKDSEATKKLFDKAIIELGNIIDSGEIADKDYMKTILTVFVGHIKMRNLEINESALKFNVNRALAESSKELQEYVRKSLPEYSGTSS